MDDLISRQAAINAPVRMVSEGIEWIPVYHVEQLPSAQPQRIKGRWLKKESVGRWDDTLWECSECGCLHRDNVFCISGDFNFCPNCGADMRGEQDE